MRTINKIVTTIITIVFVFTSTFSYGNTIEYYWNQTIENVNDTLNYLNTNDEYDKKIFTGVKDHNVYNVKENLSTTKNTLIIQGYNTDVENLQKIDIKNYDGFSLNENSTLIFSNVELGSFTETGENIKAVITNNGGNLIFQNTNKIEREIIGNITNEGSLYISAYNLGKSENNNYFVENKVVNDLSPTLYVTGGTLSKTIKGNGKTVIVQNEGVKNEVVIENDIDVYGTLTTDVENLEGKITNVGVINASGILNKTIFGEGTTKINNKLTLNEQEDGTKAKIEGTLDVNTGTICTTGDNKISTFEINSLCGTGNLEIDVDVSGTTATSDKLKIDNGNTTITLSDVNIKINDDLNKNIKDLQWSDIENNTDYITQTTNKQTFSFTSQIIDNNNVQLVLSTELAKYNYKTTSQSIYLINDESAAVVLEQNNYTLTNDDTVKKETEQVTSTININSGTLRYNLINETKYSQINIINFLNTYKTDNEKTFTFNNATDNYILASDVGDTYGVVTINGKVDDNNNLTTIDLNNKCGFVVGVGNELNINNIKFINSQYAPVQNNGGTISFDGITEFTNINRISNLGSWVTNDEGESEYVCGNAIFNGTTKFESNTTSWFYGLLSNYGTMIFNDNLEFNDNVATNAYYGLIYNSGDSNNRNTTTITFNGVSNFTNNKIYNESSYDAHGTIFNQSGTIIFNNESNFINNYAIAQNTSRKTYGGAIYNINAANSPKGIITFNDISNFENNRASYGGAIYNTNTITFNKNTVFKNNIATGVYGGAIYNSGTIYVNDGAEFKNNLSKLASGAIYNSGVIYLTAKTSNVEFTGNKANVQFDSEGNVIENTGVLTAIYNNGRIYLNSKAKSDSDDTNYKGIIFNDTIAGMAPVHINKLIDGSPTDGTVIFNADVESSMFLYSGILQILDNGSSETRNITFKSITTYAGDNKSVITSINNNFDTTAISNLTISSSSDNSFSFDVSLNNQQSDIFNIRSSNGIINVSDVNIVDETITSTDGILSSFVGDIVALNIKQSKEIDGNTYYFVHGINPGTIAYMTEDIYNTNYQVGLGNSVDGTYTLTKNADVQSSIQQSIFENNTNIEIIGNGNSIVANGVEGIKVSKDNTLKLNNVKSVYGFSSSVINNLGTIIIDDNITFENNVSTRGGAICNYKTITFSDGASFIKNKATSEGGAIYNTGTINLVANTKNVEFTGNIIANGISNAISNAIHNTGTINLYANSSNNANIIFNDKITGKGNININSQNSENYVIDGTIQYNANVENTTNLYNGTLQVSNNVTISNLNLKGGILSISNNNIDDNITINNLLLEENNSFVFDAKLQEYTSEDKILNVSDTLNINNQSGIINIVNVNDISTEETKIDEGKIKLFGSSDILYKLNTPEVVNDDDYVFMHGTDAGTIIYMKKSIYDQNYQTGLSNAIENENINQYVLNKNEYSKENLGDLQNENFTINGNNKDILANSIKGINVFENKTLTIKDVSNMLGFVSNQGGAIYNNAGTVNISNTKFLSNIAISQLYSDQDFVNAQGGAVYNNGITNIEGTVNFVNNITTSTQKDKNNALSQGGALYNNSELNFVENSIVKFNNNISKVYSDSTIIDIKVLAQGGALYNNSNAIFNGQTIFENNYASAQGSSSYLQVEGGAIYNTENGKIEFNGTSSFNNNSISSKNYAKSASGGAIYNMGILTFNNSTSFTNNQSNDVGYFVYQGGAIYNSGNIEFNSNAVFDNNGAINENPKMLGGAIYNDSGTITFNNGVSFTNNTIKNTLSNYNGQGYGSAIYNDTNGIINIKSTDTSTIEFSNNIARFGGYGAIYNKGSIAIGDNAILKNNYASVEGGAIYNIGSITLDNNVILSGNTSRDGSAIYNDTNGTIIFKDGTSFTGNSSTCNGGAIYNKSNMQFGNNTKFENNKTTATNQVNASNYCSGGAIYNIGTITFGDNTEFNNNSIASVQNSSYGSAIYNEGYIEFGNNTKFEGNTKTSVYNNSKSTGNSSEINTEMVFNGSVSFVNNNDTNNYSTIYNRSLLTFYGTAEFKNNVCSFGGATYNCSEILFKNVAVFENNIGRQTGGTIYNCNTVIFEDEAIFNNNKSYKGSAIYNDWLGVITFENGAKFTNNINYSYSISGAIHNCSYKYKDANGLQVIKQGIVNLTAKTNNILFEGNSILYSNGTSDKYNAIYNDGGIINLWSKAKDENDSEDYCGIIFNDSIAGTGTININKTNEDNNPTDGTIFLNANMENYTGEVNIYGGIVEVGENGTWFNKANSITLENTTIDVANNKLEKININAIGDNNNTIYLNIDIDVSLQEEQNEISDIFVIEDNDFVGDIVVKDICLIGDAEQFEVVTLRNSNNEILDKEIKIADDLKNKYSNGIETIVVLGDDSGYEWEDNVVFLNDDNASVTWNNKVGAQKETLKYVIDTICSNGSTTKNTIKFQRTEMAPTQIYGDPLCLINMFEPTDNTIEKTFECLDSEFSQTQEEYKVTENIGATVGVLNVKGKITEDKISTINLQDYKGFELNENSTLNISNIKLKGNGVLINNIAGNLNFKETNEIDGVIKNKSTLNIYGKTTLSQNAQLNNTGIMNVYATNNDIEFNGNEINTTGIINLLANSQNNITFNNSIAGKGIINIISNDEEGTIILNSDTREFLGTLNLQSGTLKLGKYNIKEETNILQAPSTEVLNSMSIGHASCFENADVVVTKACIEMTNSIIQATNFKNLDIENKLYLTIDVDLANEVMDMLEVTNTFSKVNDDSTIEIANMNILSETGKKEVTIQFTNTESIYDEIYTDIDMVFTKNYEYSVKYDNSNGSFVFKKSVTSVPDNINEIIEVGGYIMQSSVINEVFTSMEQHKYKHDKNKYDITDGLWLRPFGMKENVSIPGAEIDSTSYGTMVGIDLELGSKEMLTIYTGVVSSKQKKSDLKVDQIGYVAGASLTYVENNWYVGLTANIGTNKVTATTNKYYNGKDEFDMFLYTIGLKAAYELELCKTLSLEPALLAWYGNSDSSEYESNRMYNEKIPEKTWKNIQVEPMIKAKLDIGKQYKPYVFCGYAFNLGDKCEESLDRQVDEMGDGGYFEGGIGMHKDFAGTRLSIYGQVTGRLGAREGYGGDIGIKYRIGK